MKKRVILAAGIFCCIAVFLFARCGQTAVTDIDPFEKLKSPFTCSVSADIKGFVFCFDVHKLQNSLQITLTAPSSLAGISAVLDTTGFTLYKDNLTMMGSAHSANFGLQSLVVALFGGGDTEVSVTKNNIVASGSDENGDFEILFDRQNLFPIEISYKNADITAKINNFMPDTD